MQIKTGTACGQPLFLIYRPCYCSRAGERGVGGLTAGRGGTLPARRFLKSDA